MFHIHSRVLTVASFLHAITLIAPRLICGRVYKHLNQKMEFLWTKDLRINTVHVLDVAKAVWHTANWYVGNDKTGAYVFNLADDNDTDQEAVNAHIRAIFGIETGFQGKLISQMAKVLFQRYFSLCEECWRGYSLYYRRTSVTNHTLIFRLW